MGLQKPSNGAPLSRCLARAGEDGCEAPPVPAACSNDAGPSRKSALATMTRTDSCSSSCSRGTSSKRPCEGFIHDGCSYMQSFPSARS